MGQLLTLKQAAEILNVSYLRACQLSRENILPVVRLGKQLRVDPAQLEAFIAGGGKPLAGGWRKQPEARA